MKKYVIVYSQEEDLPRLVGICYSLEVAKQKATEFIEKVKSESVYEGFPECFVPIEPDVMNGEDAVGFWSWDCNEHCVSIHEAE